MPVKDGALDDIPPLRIFLPSLRKFRLTVWKQTLSVRGGGFRCRHRISQPGSDNQNPLVTETSASHGKFFILRTQLESANILREYVISRNL